MWTKEDQEVERMQREWERELVSKPHDEDDSMSDDELPQVKKNGRKEMEI